MAGHDGTRRSRTPIVVGAVGVVLLAALLAAAFQIGRAVERDAQRDALPSIEPVVIDPELYEGRFEDLLEPSRRTPIDLLDRGRPDSDIQDAAEQFSVWISPAGGPDTQRVFEEDGRVLELVGGLTDAGAGDLRTLYLSSGQRSDVADVVHSTGLVEEETGSIGSYGDRSTTITISVGGHVRTVEIDGDIPPPDTDRSVGAEVARVVLDLFDLSWLDPSIEANAEPWIPSGLTLWVQPGEVDDETIADLGGTVPWPFDEPVLSETDGVERGPFGGDQPYRCLDEAEVQTLFPLLPSGTAGSMLVDDGGVVRRLALRFDFPYYVEPRDRCP